MGQEARSHARAAPAVTAFMLLAGCLALQALPVLPRAPWLVLPAALCAWPALRHRCWRPALWCAIGFAWAGVQGVAALDARLPSALAGADLDIVGRITGLPQPGAPAARLEFLVEAATHGGEPVPLTGRVRLAWYGAPEAALVPCGRWRLRVRLKPPRALVNPGGFDAGRHALHGRLNAGGYVRDAVPVAAPRPCIDGLRARLAAAMDAALGARPALPLVQALAVADRRGISAADWTLARVNGVSHLLAISGFHIGIAALVGAWLAALLWRGLPPRRRPPRPVLQAVAALAAALVYALLAGMGLPTRRALVMIAVVCAARLARRGTGAGDSLALALIAALLVDPLAVLAPGLWLSFGGVALLVLATQAARGWRGWLAQLGRAQVVLSIALAPLGVWFFGQASIVGVVANLVAVPLVSLLVVPAVLAGCLFWPVAPTLAAGLWQLAAWWLEALWQLLAALAVLPLAHWHPPAPGAGSVVLACAGALWFLWPRGLPLRALGLLLFLPLAWPLQVPLPPGAFRVTVLDVGQGVAVLIRTREHALLYDAGPSFPSGHDLGRSVVVPALRALGVHRLERLLVSHADADHAGGAASVLGAWPGAVLHGAPGPLPRRAPTSCAAGQRWSRDGVRFELLHPGRGWPRDGNDGSCVLLVSGPGGRLLLPGDISRIGELAVAERLAPGPPLVLLVPHHGSASSSGASFLDAAQPVLAVVSSGWRNRFGHPAPAVVARYRARGVPLLDTAESGAIELLFPAAQPPRVAGLERCRRRRWWRPRRCAGRANGPGNAVIISPLVTHGGETRAGDHQGGRLGDAAHPARIGADGGDRARALLDAAAPHGAARRADR